MMKNDEGYDDNSHSRQLQGWRPPPQKHPVHEHPVFPQTAQIKLSSARARACVLGRRGEDLQVPAGDEARVAHAHVHRTLRRVPTHRHRALLHHILKLAALQTSHRCHLYLSAHGTGHDMNMKGKYETLNVPDRRHQHQQRRRLDPPPRYTREKGKGGLANQSALEEGVL